MIKLAGTCMCALHSAPTRYVIAASKPTSEFNSLDLLYLPSASLMYICIYRTEIFAASSLTIVLR